MCCKCLFDQITANSAEMQPENHQNVQKTYFLARCSRSQWVKEDYYLLTSPPKMQLTKVGHVNTLSIHQEDQGEKRNWRNRARLPLMFQIAYFRSLVFWYLLHPINILLWSDCIYVYQKSIYFAHLKFTSFNVFNSFHWLKDHGVITTCVHIWTKYL